MQMGRPGRIDHEAIRRIGGGDGGVKPQRPQREPIKRFGVGPGFCIVDDQARHQSLRLGMPRHRLLVPGLIVHSADPADDADALDRLAQGGRRRGNLWVPRSNRSAAPSCRVRASAAPLRLETRLSAIFRR